MEMQSIFSKETTRQTNGVIMWTYDKKINKLNHNYCFLLSLLLDTKLKRKKLQWMQIAGNLI
jgi:hypothetical protein